MYCKQCGAEIEDGARFCGKCGAQQETAQEQMGSASTGQSAGTQNGKDNKKWKIFVGAKIAMLWLGIATFGGLVLLSTPEPAGFIDCAFSSILGLCCFIVLLIPTYLISRGKKSNTLTVFEVLTSIIAYGLSVINVLAGIGMSL